MADHQPVACSRCGHWAQIWRETDNQHDYRVECGFCRRYVGWKSEAQLAVQRTVTEVTVITLPDPGPTLDAFMT
ncbi:hypothetical protein [Sphingobium lactosutens]|uniref:Uncharacterized protein n=1 Tax=Sphingobium lactosutens DS20 TaxID=1331060 RepID=T0IIX4_9SPHN|nr:hypothetical protein [Sphingobium lactosutens]EQB11680.1 hypothetical protein RLDS_21350 [Sphingobium lactosutens DS20]